MSSSASNHSSPRRAPNSPSTRRASTGPRGLSSLSTPSSAEYPFVSAATIQIDRTVSVTIEVLSGSALASHPQYHMPVTTSCYSPMNEHAATVPQYGISTSDSSQGPYPLTPSTTEGPSSSYYCQSSANGTQGSPGHGSEYHFPSSLLCQQQKGQYPLEFEGWLLVSDILMQAR